MGKSVTIGGDRLGSGKKMKADLHGYERSTHDLGYVFKTTMAPGTLVPFMVQLGLPGDTFDINLNADVKTHPTVGPLFGSFKLQLDVFNCPIRLYNKLLHNNKLGVGLSMADIKLPTITLYGENVDFESEIPVELQQINPSSLLAYLGYRGVVGSRAVGKPTRDFQAIPILAYWDIFKNYYANKQEENAFVIHSSYPTLTSASYENGSTPEVIYPTNVNTITIEEGTLTIEGQNINTSYVQIHLDSQTEWYWLEDLFDTITVSPDETTITATSLNNILLKTAIIDGCKITVNSYTITPKLQSFPLTNIDDMRDAILAASGSTDFNLNDPNSPNGIYPYAYLNYRYENPTTAKMFSILPQEGLAVKTYQSDIFNNWMNTDYIDGENGIAAVSAVAIVDNKFTIDTLNLSKKVYDMLNRIAISGGSYEDYIEAVYDHQSYWRAETPVYCGGLSKEIVFQEVVSTAEVTAGNPLGSLAGKGIMSNKHKGGNVTIKVDEPTFIIGLVSITPRIDYSQGNEWYTSLQTLDDLHKPALDEIGFQDLITEQMAWWNTTQETGGTVVQYSAGKIPAWLNYMTNFNKNYGNFADPNNEMFMTLNRRYTWDGETGVGIGDLTTYIDPSKFNYAFALTDLSAQNFWVQIASDIIARRKMSAKIIPNL